MRLRQNAAVETQMQRIFEGFPKDAPPMAMLSSIVAALAAHYPSLATNSFEKDLANFDLAAAIEVLEHVPDPAHTVSEMARCAQRHLLVSVPREPLWRMLNLARGAYVSELGNTPGHLNHWSRRSFVRLLSRHGEVLEIRSPFPWTMLLVRL